MQVIAAVVDLRDAQRMVRIADSALEVDHAIELIAATDRVIHALAHGFLPRSVVVGEHGAFEWPQLGAVDRDALRMGECDQLPVAGDQVLRRDRFRFMFSKAICQASGK